MNDAEKAIFNQMSDEMIMLQASGFKVVLTLDAASAMTLTGMLQLAMKHPSMLDGPLSISTNIVNHARDSLRDAGAEACAAAIDAKFAAMVPDHPLRENKRKWRN